MKKYLQLLIAVVALGYAMSGWAFGVERYLEGIHYTRAEDGKPAPNTVVEFFSFGCPHCAHLEPGIDEWLKSKPAGVKFSRVPATWNPYFQFLGRVYYALKAVGIQESAAPDMFNHIHKEGRPMKTKEDVEAFVVAHGVDKAKFDKVWESKELDKEVKDATKTLIQYKVSGVPTILVNGQYITSQSMAGSESEMFDVVNFLLTK